MGKVGRHFYTIYCTVFADCLDLKTIIHTVHVYMQNFQTKGLKILQNFSLDGRAFK